MELNEIRQGIDKIDDQISALYLERMNLVKQVSDAKKQSGKAVFDPEREKKILLLFLKVLEFARMLMRMM